MEVPLPYAQNTDRLRYELSESDNHWRILVSRNSKFQTNKKSMQEENIWFFRGESGCGSNQIGHTHFSEKKINNLISNYELLCIFWDQCKIEGISPKQPKLRSRPFNWFWLVLTGFDWFWLVLTGFTWFYLVLTGFNWFQLVLTLFEQVWTRLNCFELVWIQTLAVYGWPRLM